MSAVAPPPVDLTMSSLRVLAAREHIGEELRGTAARARRNPGILPLLGFGALCAVAAGVGALVTKRPRNFAWYRAIAKPSFTPPAPVFGIVWPVLYGLTAWSGARVWRSRATHPAANRALALWGAQLASNAAWTPLFFGAHRPKLALADLAANVVSVAGYAQATAKFDRPAALAMAPYLAWLAFAGVINAGVVKENRGPLRRLLAAG